MEMVKASRPILNGIPESMDALQLVCGACGIQTVHGQCGQYCTIVRLSDVLATLKLN